jgi:hypothetical protein
MPAPNLGAGHEREVRFIEHLDRALTLLAASPASQQVAAVAALQRAAGNPGPYEVEAAEHRDILRRITLSQITDVPDSAIMFAATPPMGQLTAQGLVVTPSADRDRLTLSHEDSGALPRHA